MPVGHDAMKIEYLSDSTRKKVTAFAKCFKIRQRIEYQRIGSLGTNLGLRVAAKRYQREVGVEVFGRAERNWPAAARSTFGSQWCQNAAGSEVLLADQLDIT